MLIYSSVQTHLSLEVWLCDFSRAFSVSSIIVLVALTYGNTILLIIANINYILEIVIVFLSIILYLYRNKNFSYFDQDKPKKDVG